MDLPHKPSDPEQLHDKVRELVEDFTTTLENKDLSVTFDCFAKQRRYGSKVKLCFGHFPHDRGTQGGYILYEAVFRIKSDFSLEAFRNWIGSQQRFAVCFER